MPKIESVTALRESNSGDADSIALLGRFEAVLLSDSGGLTQFGAFIETLHPGAFSSKRHWHEAEDEFVYMLAGQAILHEGDSETVLASGDAATFKAGDARGHRIENRSDAPATYLVVGTRADQDVVHYPDSGERMERDGDERRLFDREGRLIRQWRRSRL